MRRRYLALLTAILASALLSTPAQANARLVSVTPVDGGCVAGPTGPVVEAWDVQLLRTYALTFDNVTECSGATINVMVQNGFGTYVARVATIVSPGVYSFTFTVPGNYCETSPIRYCVTPGEPSTGYVIGRHDTGLSQSQLRYSTWRTGCLNPVVIGCPPVSTPSRSWGRIKILYR
jgi:hypothetical protein